MAHQVLNCIYFSVTRRTREFTPRYEYEIRRTYKIIPTIQGHSTNVSLSKGTKVVEMNVPHCAVPTGPVTQHGSCHVCGKRQPTSS